MGIKVDDQCKRQADGEDGLCDNCRLGDGKCCEDYDNGDAVFLSRARYLDKQMKEEGYV
jgi:hypothetical protein